MKLKSILALLLALGLLLAGCKSKSEPAASEKPSTVPPKTDAATGETKAFSMDDVKAEIDSKSVSDFTESSEPTDYVKLTIADYGELVLRLRPDVAPISVENFKGLVAKGYYDGKLFHRVYPGFMIQGGSENGDGLPGSEPSIKGEFASNGVENPLSHVRGVLSMARADPVLPDARRLHRPRRQLRGLRLRRGGARYGGSGLQGGADLQRQRAVPARDARRFDVRGVRNTESIIHTCKEEKTMAFDIKKIVEDIVSKIKNDKDIGEKFQKDPTKTVEGLIGVDLPDDQVNGVVEAVKSKINLDGVVGKLGGLFGK